MNRKFHKIIRWSLLLTVLGAMTVIGQGTTSSPMSLKVGLYKTELYDGSAWATVFDGGASAATIDLVANPGSVFGSGSIPAGTYSKIRFTLTNENRYSGSDGECSAADAPFLIDDGRPLGDPVTLTFATAAAGGGTSWYNNGTDNYPLLMVGSIDVAAGQTTRVDIIFNTASTLLCESGSFSLNPPTISVTSYVVPPSTPFTGGDYWIIHYRAALNTDFLDRNPDGTLIPPATPAEWAQVRSSAQYVSGWGFKLRFSAPDASGAGVVTIITDGTEHRHKVDETGCIAPECGVNPAGALGGVFNYTLSADNRIRLTVPGETGSYWGALSRDFNVLIGVNMELGNDGRDMLLGIKVATAARTMTGLYAMNGYDANFGYPTGVSTASFLGFGGGFGWIDLAPVAEGLEYTSKVEISNPAGTTAAAVAYTGSSSGGGGPSSISVGADGIYADPSGEGSWLALSPDGNAAISAGGTNDINADDSTPALEKHYLGYGLVLKQEPAGTYAAASLAGTYILVGAYDGIAFDGAPCAPPHAVPGSATCGSGITQRNGAAYGEMTLTASGAVSMNITNVDFLGVVSYMTGTGAFTVEQQCFGMSGGARLPFDDAVCAGGRKLDMVVLRDSGGIFAKMFIGDNGDVLTHFDPKSIEPVAGTAGMHRSLGYAVKIH